MKAVVVYKSKSGFAKKYAEWISEELKADIYSVSEATTSMLRDYVNS
jgi:flavodoxin